MALNQKAFITVTPEKPIGSTAKFCPLSDKTSAISLNCSTPIITSQPTTNPVCEGAPVLRVGSLNSCGHSIVQGSNNVFCP
jgi:hypothetical protein